MLKKLHVPKAQLERCDIVNAHYIMYYNIATKYISDACNYQNGDTH